MGLSGADLEYQRKLSEAGLTAQQAVGMDGARLEQLSDQRIKDNIPVNISDIRATVSTDTVSSGSDIEIAIVAKQLQGLVDAGSRRNAVDTRVSAVEAIVRRAPGVRYKPVVGVIRKTAGVWALINDVGHAPTGIASISSTATYIRVTFDHTATKVGTMLCSADEAYAAEGYHIGASVAVDWADLYIYKRQAALGGYVYYDVASTSWKCSPTGMFTAFSFTGNTLYMEHASVKPASTNLMVSVVGRGSGPYEYTVGSISATITRVEIWKPTVSGTDVVKTAVTVPAADMKFYVMRGSDGYFLVDPSTMAEGTTNLWLLGQNEITPPS